MNNLPDPKPTTALTRATAADYAAMLEVMLAGMSNGSRRQYEHTYADWRVWCAANSIDPGAISAPNVMRYLNERPLSRATKQARLTHLRRLVQTLYSADTTNTRLETYYAQLKMMRLSVDDAPAEPNPKGKKRPGKRLDGSRVHELIAAYPVSLDGKPHLRGLRNRALLAVLFYAGLRRFEAVKLKWADIDFEQEHIQVVGGKSRKRDAVDYVPFLGSLARHLQAWRAHTPDRVYVFPRIYKGNHIGQDQPISDDGLYRQFAADFAPHDARRTLISDLLESGTYIGDVKAIARHTNESTTLRYAKPHETKVIKSRAKLGY
ncbi:MAG: site-specific integrase [Chloroflexi bacterium]|nr:site-specific integrase [Chloroflexota bacterium]